MKLLKQPYFWIALVVIIILLTWLWPAKGGVQMSGNSAAQSQDPQAVERKQKVAEIAASGDFEQIQQMTPEEKTEYRRQRRIERAQKNMEFVDSAYEDVIGQIEKLQRDGEYQKLLQEENSVLKKQLQNYLPQLQSESDFEASNVIRLLREKKQRIVGELQHQLESQR